MYRKERKAQLQELLDSVHIKNRDEGGEETQKYYQGFNDIASVFLLTLGQNLAFYCTDAAGRYILSDFLELPFDEGLVPLFQLVFFLLEKVDTNLYMLVTDDGNNPTAPFTTSWFLTLFCHDIERFETV